METTQNYIDNPDIADNILNEPTNQINLNKGVSDIQKANEQQKEIRIQERADETFGDLIGQKFKKGDIIKFLFMSKNGEKIPCSFNLNNQTLEFNGKIYDIKLPSGAYIKEVSFLDNEITIVGKVAFFTGEGKTSNGDMMKSLDEVFETGHTVIVAENGDKIKMNLKA